MAKCQPIAEFGEHTACVLSAIRMRRSVMEMDLNFSPTGVAMLGQPLEQALIVLLGRIKIGMQQWAAVVVSPTVENFRVFGRPIFQATLLLRVRDALTAIRRIDGGFEVIGQGE